MADKLSRITGTDSLKKYFDTDYIGAYSIDEGTEPILTIEGIYHGDLTLIGGRKEHHVVVKFKESRVPGIDEVKPMILNSTNRQALKKIYGSDSASVLEGRRIQLYIDPKVRNPSDGELGPALRIRAIVPQVSGKMETICFDCGKQIESRTDASGKEWTAEQVARSRYNKFGKVLCSVCSELEKAKSAPADPLGGANAT